MLDLLIGIHLFTAHAGEQEPMKAVTPGVYAKHSSGWAGGIYGNSVGATSVWAGRVFETADKRWALTVGAVTGYGRREGQKYCGPGNTHRPGHECYRGHGNDVALMVAPSVRFGDDVAVRFTYMPKVGWGAHSLHMSVEF